MDMHTLHEATRLEKERVANFKLTNLAYNDHMYMHIILGDTDVTKQLPKVVTDIISTALEDYFRAKGEEAQRQLDAL